jgi:general secretion pathway protein E
MSSAREAAAACGLPFAETPPRLPPRELLASLPMQYARRHLVLPLGRGPDTLEVAMADPAALTPLDDLRLLYGLRIQPLVVPANVLREAIARAYDAAAAAAADDGSTLGARLELDVTALDEAEPPDLLEAGEDAPAIRLVNAVLYEAVRAGASDVHVEPFERSVAVRLRIDGVLHDLLAPPLSLHAALVSRVKIMAGLDIAERRLPHDGRIPLRVGGRDVDVRVSIVPTAAGERMVLRLLDRASVLRDVAELGLAAATTSGLETLLARSHGLLLVTGPTGSGKTTTLYALLRRLATGERNIMTIEDPIEYQLRGIGQLQVAPRIGLTFAAGLRSILRQDPDVILVGEIRDRETMEIALQAALTGHLVLATLHTNDACSTLTRLLDMGAEPYLIASSVAGVLAQRLVRRVCAGCQGTGCARCRQSGFSGRTGIHELLILDDEARALVMARADAAALRRHAPAAGMTSLRDDGFAKAEAGITTEAEVLRVTRDDES